MADLKKDFFLLCKKENLARTHSTKNSRRVTDTTSCSNVSQVNSPTSPCQWNVGFSDQVPRLDSVFDGDGRSVSDVTTPADDESKEVSKVERFDGVVVRSRTSRVS